MFKFILKVLPLIGIIFAVCYKVAYMFRTTNLLLTPQNEPGVININKFDFEALCNPEKESTNGNTLWVEDEIIEISMESLNPLLNCSLHLVSNFSDKMHFGFTYLNLPSIDSHCLVTLQVGGFHHLCTSSPDLLKDGVVVLDSSTNIVLTSMCDINSGTYLNPKGVDFSCNAESPGKNFGFSFTVLQGIKKPKNSSEISAGGIVAIVIIVLIFFTFIFGCFVNYNKGQNQNAVSFESNLIERRRFERPPSRNQTLKTNKQKVGPVSIEEPKSASPTVGSTSNPASPSSWSIPGPSREREQTSDIFYSGDFSSSSEPNTGPTIGVTEAQVERVPVSPSPDPLERAESPAAGVDVKTRARRGTKIRRSVTNVNLDIEEITDTDFANAMARNKAAKPV